MPDPAHLLRFLPLTLLLLAAPVVHRALPPLTALYLILLALIAALTGLLPLAHLESPRASSLIATLLALFLAVPVLHIPSTYAYIHRDPASVLLSAALVTALSAVTIIALLAPAYPPYLQSAADALAIVFSLLAGVRLITALYQPRWSPPSEPVSIPLVLPSAPLPTHAKADSVDSDNIILAHCDLTRAADTQLRPVCRRSRILLTLFASAQLAFLVAHSLSIPLALLHASQLAHRILDILYSFFIVTAVTATMAGYLLHAYNASFFVDHSPSPSSSESSINLSAYNHPFARRYLDSADPPPASPSHHVQLVDSRPQQLVIQLASPPMLPRRKRLNIAPPPPSAIKRCASLFRPRHKDHDNAMATDSTDELSPMEFPKEGDSLLLGPGSDTQSPARLAYDSPSSVESPPPFIHIKDRHAVTRAIFESEIVEQPGKQNHTAVPPPARRLLGWEFGWDPLPAARESRLVRSFSSRNATGTAKGQKRFTQPPLPAVPAPVQVSPPCPPRKLRKPSSSHARKPSVGSRPMSTDSGVVIITSPCTSPQDRGHSPGADHAESPNAIPSEPLSGNPSSSSPLPSPLVTPTTAHHNMMAKFRRSLSQSSRPSISDSFSTDQSQGPTEGVVVSKGGLRLRKSFKMGVGRTLGPGLTLAAASGPTIMTSKVLVKKESKRQSAMTTSTVAATVREWVRITDDLIHGEGEGAREGDEGVKVQSSDDSMDEEEDEETRSIAAARLVSASYARATTAATIVTSAPASGAATTSTSQSMPCSTSRPASPVPAMTQLEPASSIGLTSSLATASTSSNPPSGFPTWDSHPFAGPVQPGGQALASVPGLGLGFGNASPSLAMHHQDYEVVTLEGGMEEGMSRMGDEEGVPMELYGMSMSAILPAITVQPAAPSTPPSSGHPHPVAGPSTPPNQKSRIGRPSFGFSSPSLRSKSRTSPEGSPTQATLGQALKKKRSKGWLGIESSVSSRPSSPSPSLMNPSPSPTPTISRCPSPAPSRFPLIFGISTSSLDRSRPGTPKGGKTPGRSSTMDTVRNALSGVVGGGSMGRKASGESGRDRLASGAAVARSSLGGSGKGRVVNDEQPSSVGYGYGEDGDFMDLRDPFAPSPVMLYGAIRRKTEEEQREDCHQRQQQQQQQRGMCLGVEDAFGRFPKSAKVLGAATVPSVNANGKGRNLKVDAWGRLPVISKSSPSTSIPQTTTTTGTGAITSNKSRRPGIPARLVGSGSAGVGVTRKKSLTTGKRVRKRTLSGFRIQIPGYHQHPHQPQHREVHEQDGEEDVAIALEEALLAQRLLRRLDGAED